MPTRRGARVLALLQALNILRGMDVAKLGITRPAYLHLVAEAFNLAFADREAYLGDPRFVRVPVEGLLSEEYARTQRARIDRNRAFGQMPPPGRPAGSEGLGLAHLEKARRSPGKAMAAAPDTIYCSVVDRAGNVYSGTLSDNTHDTPLIPARGSRSPRAARSRGSIRRTPRSWPPGKRPR
jgi:gamma-glutamyltranspeptidase/glutathione hydrolase